ncbi:zinc finger A20 and AN1 domain-containing stress-associated protein 5-like [Phragmites australis]|uniref:zinc finger A20 and AN1 domain-containing stress-associated protein 5-like n=1 Tax=Phragmites australis TaxID=29695 RepID=UPI002D78FFF1|nr:zinc finger A20 and AN1 domain-containing stress-associated protein 5-like [Phragmites australis]
MAEEQRWQEGHRLCASNCGFFNSLATVDLCPKCYHNNHQQQHPTVAAAQAPSTPAPLAFQPSSEPELEQSTLVAASCQKRVGLTGFACRCGATFCGVHRYPERHACEFDFRAAGRDAIAFANPIMKVDKLNDKI